MKSTKTKSIFRCQECGYAVPKWLGKCPECSRWNTFVEEEQANIPRGAKSRPITDFSSSVLPLNDVKIEDCKRFPTSISEFDRIIGGGIVPGSLVLLGGPPGIGKSTLMLQVLAKLANNKSVLYVSGEESLAQIKLRAERLKVSANKLYCVSETNLESIIESINKTSPEVVVIDSIQTMYRTDLISAPGSVGQVRECAAEFLRIAKARGLCMFLLGHVTKEGDLAGPRVLEHIVDTVLYFETERQQIFRILRAYKNRFGPTNEIGVFEMKGDGLNEVKNPSELFLQERSVNIPGTTVVSLMEGTRSIFLEIQALVAKSNFGFPKRMVTGYDVNKVSLLIAVLEKRLGLHLETEDVFVNVVGGVKIKEPGVELGIACAIASAYVGFQCPAKSVIIGEVGLTGEVRSVPQLPARLAEAEKLGFESAIVPKGNLKNSEYKGKIKIVGVETLQSALEHIKQRQD